MSFLAPLYMAGMAAVALPILFHMIRRTPKGKVPFSTLMFLEPSPPRVTRRSSIEHWLLLLLRAAAVILLAFAFSRPFLRQSEDQLITGESKRTAILVDISASMRREGLWAQALKQVNLVLDDAGPLDEVSLLAFDRQLQPLLTFEEWDGLEASTREAIVRQRLTTLKPGWLGTDLGRVLPEAVTTLLDHADKLQSVRQAELILISDIQRGSRAESLQAFDWPDSVTVQIRSLKAKTNDNSSLQIVGTTIHQDGLRIRVNNELDSRPERFDLLAEAVDAVPVSTEPPTVAQTIPTDTSGKTQIIPATHRREIPEWAIRDIHVPPGQNRVVKLSDLPSERTAFRLTLTGDKTSFDNEAWFVRPSPPIVTVQYHGDGDASDAQSLRYYLERAFLSTPAREVDFVAEDVEFPSTGNQGLTIVSHLLDDDQFQKVETAFKAGNQVLVVGATSELCEQAFRIAVPQSDILKYSATEAAVDGYAMLGNVQLQHPLFQPFDDAKLSDFTKLPVWKHRTLKHQAVTGSPKATATVLASFDNGDPAVIEIKRQLDVSGREGSVLLFTFGWHGSDSRFVLWSKFVPMMNHLVDRLAGTDRETTRLTVGESIHVRDVASNATSDVEITMPSGTRSTVNPESSTLRLNEPGVFSIAWKGPAGPRSTALAVNLDPLESRTSPLGLDELRALGVPLPEATVDLQSPEEKRQLQARELESRQRFWQWVILASVLILLAETWLAGRLAQQTQHAAQPS